MPAVPTAPKADDKPEPKITTRVWEALTNLSIGRGATDKERMADIVHKGETVALTEEQAHGFLHRHRVPVIRPAKDQNEPAPDITARALFGPQPTAQQFGVRADPPGASRVIVNDPDHAGKAPEANDPKVDFSVDPAAAKDH